MDKISLLAGIVSFVGLLILGSVNANKSKDKRHLFGLPHFVALLVQSVIIAFAIAVAVEIKVQSH